MTYPAGTASVSHRLTSLQSYIHGSSQGQFVAETYIVMILHGAVTVGVITMNEACSVKGIDGSVRKSELLCSVKCTVLFYGENITQMSPSVSLTNT